MYRAVSRILKTQRIVDQLCILARIADSACLTVRVLGLNEIWIMDLSSALVSMLTTFILIIFEKKKADGKESGQSIFSYFKHRQNYRQIEGYLKIITPCRSGVGRSREGVGHQFLNPW